MIGGNNPVPNHGRDVHYDPVWPAMPQMVRRPYRRTHNPYVGPAVVPHDCTAVVVALHAKGFPREVLRDGHKSPTVLSALHNLLAATSAADPAAPELHLKDVYSVDERTFTINFFVTVFATAGAAAADHAVISDTIQRLNGSHLFDRHHIITDAAASAARGESAVLRAYGNRIADVPQEQRHFAMDGLPYRPVRVSLLIYRA